MLDGFLELLTLCICQENDTIARIGSTCLQQLILENVEKLQPSHWDSIVRAYTNLFEVTTAYSLFSVEILKPLGQIESSEIGDPGESTHLDVINSKVEGKEAEGDPSAITSIDEQALENATRSTNISHGEASARKKEFKQIIVKCVLQLLLIENVSELLARDEVYLRMPSENLLELMESLRKSYQFANKFNNDRELRINLWKIGI